MRQDLEQGGFTTPIPAQNTEEFAFFDIKTHPTERMLQCVALLAVSHINQGGFKRAALFFREFKILVHGINRNS